MSNPLVTVLKTTLARAGFELHRRGTPPDTHRASLEGALAQVKSAGLAPATIFDVGAAYGEASHALGSSFPEARIVAFEALRAYAPVLEGVIRRQQRGQIVWAAAGSRDGSVTFNVHNDLVGSSLYKEAEGASVDGEEQTVPMLTLDTVAARDGLTGPYLVKIDVQGAELDVLRGAPDVLSQTECLILEVSLFKTLLGGPQLAEVVAYLQERGFVCYDLFGANYRLLDGALAQIDMAFVREEGPLRSDHRYARPEQRRAQDEAMDKTVRKLKR